MKHVYLVVFISTLIVGCESEPPLQAVYPKSFIAYIDGSVVGKPHTHASVCLKAARLVAEGKSYVCKGTVRLIAR